jgi:translation initiation factor 4A
MNSLLGIESNGTDSVESFEAMNLKQELLRGIFSYGFEHPSSIQQNAIPPLLHGRDLIGQAQSGSGKTAAFAVALLERIAASDSKGCQGLILVPTRELAQQVTRVVTQLAQYMDLRCHCCIGGTRVREDIRAIEAGTDIAIGTPGRIYDLITRQVLTLTRLRMLVIDEADLMLDRGFQDQIKQIMATLPGNTQLALFSATLPAEVLSLTQLFMQNPVQILLKQEVLALQGIKQYYIAVEKDAWKNDIICDLYANLDIAQAIIYCNSRKRAEELTSYLSEKDFAVSLIHGDLDAETRSSVMRAFITGKDRVLVSTDLLARGIDVQQVSLVINYDVPTSVNTYMHRIGRSGRFGRKGVAITLATSEDSKTLQTLEQHFDTHICELPEDLAEIL